MRILQRTKKWSRRLIGRAKTLRSPEPPKHPSAVLLKELKSTLLRIGRCSSGTTNRGDIVIGLHRTDLFYSALSVLLGRFLAERGFRVHVVLDDGQLPHYDVHRFGRHSDAKMDELITEMCRQHLLDPTKILQGNRHVLAPIRSLMQWAEEDCSVATIWTSEVLRKSALNVDEYSQRCEQLLGGKISKHVLASHYRCFGGHPFNPKNETHLDYAKLSVKAELVQHAVADHLIQDRQPVLYMTLDGMYVTFGVVLERLEKANCPCLVFQPNGFQDRRMDIGREPSPWNAAPTEWEAFASSSNCEEYMKQARPVMDRRVRPRSADDDATRQCRERLRCLRDTHKRVVALFPNCNWDANCEDRDKIFEGLLPWLTETVEWASRNNIGVVIREHPLPDSVYNRHESILCALSETAPEICSAANVLCIDGLTRLSSFDLVKNWVDCSCVYNGTIAVEIAYMGHPVVIASRSPYENKGIGFVPSSKNEYFDLLQRIHLGSPEFSERKAQIAENALRAAAFRFFGTSYYCPILPLAKAYGLDNFGASRYWGSWDTGLDKLDPRQCDAWRRTIDRIVAEADRTDADAQQCL